MKRKAGWFVAILMITATSLGLPLSASAVTLHAGIQDSYASPPPPPPAISPNEPGAVGVELSVRAGTAPVIDEVYPGTPAERAGLRVGDTLLAVNNMSLQDLTTQEVNATIPKHPGMKDLFMVRRQGRVFQVSVTIVAASSLQACNIRALYQSMMPY